MNSKTYKHSISITSQVYFCAAPIRIDSYNTCQFGCVYCFSRQRSQRAAKKGIYSASPDALRKRLTRVSSGIIKSALDEFLEQRIPIQLGGLQDPFTPLEQQNKITLSILKILKDFNYPTIISTKGSIYTSNEYLDVLREMNLVFRISAAGVEEKYRLDIDRKASSFGDTLRRIELLKKNHITTALRIQPVFPSQEEAALDMTTSAANAGVSQVTFEYLKLPSEEIRNDVTTFGGDLGKQTIPLMKEMGIKRIGPDWTLTADAKRSFVRTARKHCHQLGIRFGAGDTEFIPWSDGNGCCGSSDLFLDAKQFTTNFVGVIKNALSTNPARLEFKYFSDTWIPQFSVGNYLDYRSRVKQEGPNGADWLAMLKRRWNGSKSPYSPSFFDGIVNIGDFDDQGFKIYNASNLANELLSK